MLFHMMDGQKKSDGKLQLDEFVAGMAAMGADDASFKKEMEGMLAELKKKKAAPAAPAAKAAPAAEGAAATTATPAASADHLNILLQEDLTIRGGAQLWLMNCGSRLQAAGHNVTFLLPSESLIIEDCEKIEGAKVHVSSGFQPASCRRASTLLIMKAHRVSHVRISSSQVVKYDAAKIAESPADFKPMFTELLAPAQVCVTLVRQQRGEFQNVGFMAECIQSAGLNTFLIAKTGTPDPTYKTSFYGEKLFPKSQCCVITIAQCKWRSPRIEPQGGRVCARQCTGLLRALAVHARTDGSAIAVCAAARASQNLLPLTSYLLPLTSYLYLLPITYYLLPHTHRRYQGLHRREHGRACRPHHQRLQR